MGWSASSLPILVSNVLLWNFYHIVVSRLYARIPLRIDGPLESLLIAALPMGGGVMLRQLRSSLTSLSLPG